MATARVKNPSIMINLRLKLTQRDLIDQAAEAVGKNRSEFLLDAATRAAQEALLDQRILYLNEDQWNEFQKAMKRPPRVNQRLKQAMARKPTWKPS